MKRGRDCLLGRGSHSSKSSNSNRGCSKSSNIRVSSSKWDRISRNSIGGLKEEEEEEQEVEENHDGHPWRCPCARFHTPLRRRPEMTMRTMPAPSSHRGQNFGGEEGRAGRSRVLGTGRIPRRRRRRNLLQRRLTGSQRR